MTEEKRQPQEQIATHVYRRPVVSSAPHLGAGRHRAPAETPVAAENVSSRQRVVTTLDTVQPSAGERYVHRRNQLYSARARRQTYTHMTPRTLAQTGVRASSGQMRAIKRLPQYHASPVPVRSGRHGKNRNFFLRLLALFALLVVLGIGANFVLTGAAFRVAQVSVIGTHNMSLVQTIQHMGMQGQNIFLIDAVALTARIDLLPLVSWAKLEKQWPDRLLVTVSERTPVLLWQTSYGTYSVDRNGVVIAPASETTNASTLMTVIDKSNAGKQKLHPGSRLPAADIAFARAIFEQLPKVTGTTDFTLNYALVPASGQGNQGGYGSYVVVSKTGWLAYLGAANDANPLSNRLVELQQILLLAQQGQLNLATIDLRFGFRPVYTLKS
ncbi:MAG: cell division protein FtsQ/DivIB [Ktedonobacteraceae bacterium]